MIGRDAAECLTGPATSRQIRGGSASERWRDNDL
jgi:hypothetical protein